jgi:hypothetical protein
MTFLTPNQAFLRAAKTSPQLTYESFLEDAHNHIADSKLRASGFRFHKQKMRLFAPITSESAELMCTDPLIVSEFVSPDRTDIRPLVMADYTGPDYDGRITRVSGYNIDGWEDVRLAVEDIDHL